MYMHALNAKCKCFVLSSTGGRDGRGMQYESKILSRSLTSAKFKYTVSHSTKTFRAADIKSVQCPTADLLL